MDKKVSELENALSTIESISGTKLISLKNMLTCIYQTSPTNMEEIVREIKNLRSAFKSWSWNVKED